ncbi:MAG: pilus assembly protein N-terminal domain-containing protein [Gammaproteobacteria bacterium]|nr:pilus assembly protein N-terminal domain-containing protein [Gammaproteobacteria bacterium]
MTRLNALRTAGMLCLLLWQGLLHAEPGVLRVEAGGHHLMTRPGGVARLAVANPEVADVELLSARELLVVGKQLGETQLRLWPKGAPVEEYRIIVEAPGASNRDAVSSQVQTDIKVVEVSRQALMQSGMMLGKNAGNTTLAIGAPGSLSGVTSSTAGAEGFGGSGFTLESSSGFLPIAQAFNLVAGNAKKGLLGVVSVLENNGFAYTLAEPSLTVMNGQTATFLAGGEFPIPIQGEDGIEIDYKEFGVRLMLTPTVLDTNRIVLKVAPEVSELDFSTTAQTAGGQVPALRVRRTETTIQLAEGESFVISGLISRNNVAAVDKVPFLGDLPIIGAFFKSTRVQREDKELIMVVTPHLVRAMARGAPTPALPGEGFGRYQPGFADLLFLETGRFDRLNDKASR